jgi:hypothetical protein
MEGRSPLGTLAGVRNGRTQVMEQRKAHDMIVATLRRPRVVLLLVGLAAGLVAGLGVGARPAAAGPVVVWDYYDVHGTQPIVVQPMLNDIPKPYMHIIAEWMTTPGSISCNHNSWGAGAGSCTFTPAAGFTGSAQAKYRVEWWTPQGWLTDEGWIEFTVSNTAPVGGADSVSIWRNTPVVDIWVLANDFDPDGDPITMDTLTYSAPSSGSLYCQSNGRCQYGPPKGWTGTTSFYYRATDGIGVSAATKVTITVSNRGAVGANQSFALAQGQEKIVNLLAGAYDPDGDPIRVKATGPISAGQLNCNEYFWCAYFAPLQSTTVAIDYFVADDLGAGSWVTLTFTISGPPLASPVAGTPVSSPSTPIAIPATPVTRGSGATRAGAPPPAEPSVEPTMTSSHDPTIVTEPTVAQSGPAEPTAEQTDLVAEPTEPIAEPTEVPAESAAAEAPPASPGDGEATPGVAAATMPPDNDGPDNPADGLLDHVGVLLTGLVLVTVLAPVVAEYRTTRRRRASLTERGYPSPIPAVSLHGVAD